MTKSQPQGNVVLADQQAASAVLYSVLAEVAAASSAVEPVAVETTSFLDGYCLLLSCVDTCAFESFDMSAHASDMSSFPTVKVL